MADIRDPDLAHLFELLRMLPGPTEDRDFWLAVNQRVMGHDANLDYVYEKMTLIPRTFQDPSPGHISDLTRYLVFFFSGNSPELWDLLGCTTPDLQPRDDQSGRWWAKDVCATAWTLYVRYSPMHDHEQWMAKWQYKRDWLEWLPPKGWIPGSA